VKAVEGRGRSKTSGEGFVNIRHVGFKEGVKE